MITPKKHQKGMDGQNLSISGPWPVKVMDHHPQLRELLWLSCGDTKQQHVLRTTLLRRLVEILFIPGYSIKICFFLFSVLINRYREIWYSVCAYTYLFIHLIIPIYNWYPLRCYVCLYVCVWLKQHSLHWLLQWKSCVFGWRRSGCASQSRRRLETMNSWKLFVRWLCHHLLAFVVLNAISYSNPHNVKLLPHNISPTPEQISTQTF